MSKITTLINAILIDPKTLTQTNGSITIEEGFIKRINGPARGNICLLYTSPSPRD